MMIAPLLKSRMKRRNFTEGRTIMCHETIINYQRASRWAAQGVARFIVNANQGIM
jgi:hypothetical protein